MSYLDCEYVSTWGLMLSCDIYPRIIKHREKVSPNYLIDLLMSNNSTPKSIYVHPENLEFFCKVILNNISFNFVLVTGNSDETLSLRNDCPYKQYIDTILNNKYLLKWFSQNFDKTGERTFKKEFIVQLPIGIDYHTIDNEPLHHWRMYNEEYTPIGQENLLKYTHTVCNNTYKGRKEPLIYCNAHFAKTSLFNDRINALQLVPRELLVVENFYTHRKISWEKTCKYQFVLSPFGNGLDCHRTWETLCLGSIPVVRTNVFKELFSDLPVLIVENWEDITQDVLEKCLDDFSKRKFNLEKLTLKYWVQKINGALSF